MLPPIERSIHNLGKGHSYLAYIIILNRSTTKIQFL